MNIQTGRSFIHKALKKSILNFLIIGIITAVIYVFYPSLDAILPTDYITNTVNGIGSFLEMSIGIYIAVISILATARTTITEKLSQNNKHENFIVTISVGFVETVLALIFSEILFDINSLTKSITLALILISIFQISIFFFALLLMFNITVSGASSEAHDEQKKHKEIIIHLKTIQNRLEDIIKK